MRSVQRILGVFETFSADQPTLTLQEIAERIELPKSTTFRIVQSIEREGYLVRLDDQRYGLSFRFTRLAGLVKSTLDIREIARPIASELAESTKETVTLQMLSGANRVCIDAVATSATLRSVTQPGETAALTLGSSSKMLVANLSPKQQTPLVSQIARATGQTQAAVRAELKRIREDGYSVSHGERVLGVSGISAPIYGVAEQVTYCLSVAGPTVRMQEQEQALVRMVVKAAADISRLYGGEIRANP